MPTKDLDQFNPTLDKMGSQLGQAGAASLGPILAGFPGRFTIRLDDGEALSLVQIVNDDGLVISTPTITTSTDGETASIDVTFGTDTSTGVPPVRNHVVWTTTFGVSRRHFWVRDFPSADGVYVDNQDAQGAEAVVDCNLDDAIAYARKADFSIAFFPAINDEFFTQHELTLNRWANTIRNWGGVETVQIWLDAVEIWGETDIADVDGYFWEPTVYGTHTLLCRFRAKEGSSTYQDISATIRLRQTPCGGEAHEG